MTTQAEMRKMRKGGKHSQKEMAAHVKSSGGYNGVANGYAGDGKGGGNNTKAAVAAAAKAAVVNPPTGLDKAVRSFLAPLGDASKKFREGMQDHPLIQGLDATLGIFGNHKGQTYGESTAPDYYPFPGAKNDAYETHMRNLGPLDGFTYQMTDDEHNAQLDHAFIGKPTTDAQRLAVKEGRVRPNGGLFTGEDTGGQSVPAITSPPVSGGGSSNGGYFPGGGGNNGSVNRTGYADNYFQAIPDSVFNSVISEDGITSPRLKPVPISYGNSYNAGRRWKSGVFGQQQNIGTQEKDNGKQ